MIQKFIKISAKAFIKFRAINNGNNNIIEPDYFSFSDLLDNDYHVLAA
jgi:hypothetical protein